MAPVVQTKALLRKLERFASRRILPTRVGVQDTTVVPYCRRAYVRLIISSLTNSWV